MATPISVALGVEGAREFQESIKQSNAAIKVLGSELKLTQAEMGDAAKSEEGLRAQNDVLERTILTLNEKLGEQLKALDALGAEYGEGSVQTLKMQEEVNKTKTAIANATTQIQNNTTAIEEMGSEAETAGEKTSVFGDVLKANLASEAITDGVKKLAGALKDLALSTAFKADDIVTLATQTGLTTDAVQEFAYMENLLDVSTDTLTGSMSKLIRQMSSAKDGSGDAADAFDALGASITDSSGDLRSNQDVFYEVIDSLGSIQNATERDAIAMSLFGKSAQDLNPLIEAGTDAMAALAQEAHDVGYVMGEEALNTLLETSDAYERMNKSVDALKSQIGEQLAPAETEILTILTDFIGRIDEFTPLIAGAATAMGIYAASFGIAALISKVKAATEGMTIAQAALNAVVAANPIGLLVGGLAGLASAFVVAYKTNDEFRAKVDESWASLKDGSIGAVLSVLGRLNDLSDGFDTLRLEARTWGKDLIDNFVAGIQSKIQSVRDTISGIAQTVRDFIGFSEPKRGPLSNFHTYAPDMMQLYAQGIRDNAHLVTDAMDSSISAPIATQTPMQKTAAGIVNALQTAMSGYGGALTVNLVMPDGRIFASYYLDSFVQTAKANGTPILNPM